MKLACTMLLICIIVCVIIFASCSDDPVSPVEPGNRPPAVPHSPEPADSSEYASENLIVYWEGGDPDGDVVVYSVQIREGEAVFSPGQTIYTSMDTGFFLQRSTTYNWRVIATDGLEISEGPWWTIFTPEYSNEPPYRPADPFPADGAAGVQTTGAVLTWSADDPDEGDALNFTVYFGTGEDPPIAASGITETSYSLSVLDAGTEYFWRIEVTDSRGESALGPVWSFTTQP